MADLKLLSDEELESSLNDILNEKERRQRLEAIPHTINELANQFRAGGGNQEVLTQAVAT